MGSWTSIDAAHECVEHSHRWRSKQSTVRRSHQLGYSWLVDTLSKRRTGCLDMELVRGTSQMGMMDTELERAQGNLGTDLPTNKQNKRHQ